ncbi:MAG TPA: hypothetical protein VN625_09765 [Desulfuromonadaceae bacterium]|nr:hypothetical protein [Desulfuromonadaceae bacterium]
MQIYLGQFNLKRYWHGATAYAATFPRPMAAITLALGIALLCGCQTDKNKKLISIIRVHIEVTTPNATSQTVSVLRSSPVMVTILKDPVCTEANVLAAKVIDTPGGFGIQVAFDDTGMWMLQNYSAMNPGKHFVIFGQWGEKISEGRTLAAPLITRRITDGILTFSADMTRDEANQFVIGLNNVYKKAHKGESKLFKK